MNYFQRLQPETKKIVFEYLLGYENLLRCVCKDFKQLLQQSSVIVVSPGLSVAAKNAIFSGKFNTSSLETTPQSQNEKYFFYLTEDFISRQDFDTLNISFKFNLEPVSGYQPIRNSRVAMTSGNIDPTKKTYIDASNELIDLSFRERETPYQKAIKYNCPSTLKYIRKQQGTQPTWDVYTSIYAAKYGRLEMLQWLWSQEPKCTWSQHLPAHAAAGGHLSVLKWLKEQRGTYNWGQEAFSFPIRGGKSVLEFFSQEKLVSPSEDSLISAAQRNDLEMCKWLRNLDPPCPWSDLFLTRAVQANAFEVIKWARSQDPPCPWSPYPLFFAVERGYMEMVKWFRSQNPPCPWNEETIVYAARGKNMEMLQWLRSQNPPCPWGTKATAKAAKNGNFEMLQWMRSQNPPCPWDWETMSEASHTGNLELVKWLLKNGCPTSDYTNESLAKKWPNENFKK